MTDIIAGHIEFAASHAVVWGFIIIFIFMTIESSFIPFPSEVVMIPAGFLAYRGALTTGIPWLDLVLAVFFGLLGSLAGAYVNYYLSVWLGRPFLHKYGRYFFLSEEHLDRAEEIFRKYGDIATFVCRLLPAAGAFHAFYRARRRNLDCDSRRDRLVSGASCRRYELS